MGSLFSSSQALPSFQASRPSEYETVYRVSSPPQETPFLRQVSPPLWTSSYENSNFPIFSYFPCSPCVSAAPFLIGQRETLFKSPHIFSFQFVYFSPPQKRKIFFLSHTAREYPPRPDLFHSMVVTSLKYTLPSLLLLDGRTLPSLPIEAFFSIRHLAFRKQKSRTLK